MEVFYNSACEKHFITYLPTIYTYLSLIDTAYSISEVCHISEAKQISKHISHPVMACNLT